MSLQPAKHDARHIQLLEGWEAIRKRPGMYIGSTSERGLRQMVLEVVNRAVGDFLQGRAHSIEITLLADGGVRVADDGQGVAFVDPDGGGLDRSLTRLFTPLSESRHTVAWFVGLCVANALSSRLVAEVWGGGVREIREYSRGAAVTPEPGPAPAPGAAFTEAGPAAESGTAITFWPDLDIFEDTELSFDALADRCRELTFLIPGLEISLTDDRVPERRSLNFHAPDGLRDMVAFLEDSAEALVHPDVIAFERDDPRMAGTMEVAFRWHDSSRKRITSFANCGSTPDAGTHVAGFDDGLKAALNAYAREQGLLTAADPDLGADRISEGLTAVVSVKLDQVTYLGSTRGMLGNAEVQDCVRDAVTDYLGTWLAEQPQQAAAVVDRAVQATRRD